MLSVAEKPTRPYGLAARKRYSRIPEVLPVPNLIELQLDSFRWFVEQGLRELFDEISPIKDFTGKVMELHFAVPERTASGPRSLIWSWRTSWPGPATASGRRSTARRSAGSRTSPSVGPSTSTSS